MRADLVLYFAGANQLNKIRRIPVRVSFPVPGWIMSIPVAIPAKIFRRPQHILMSESRGPALTSLQKEMADCCPGNRDSCFFKNTEDVWHVSPAGNSTL